MEVIETVSGVAIRITLAVVGSLAAVSRLRTVLPGILGVVRETQTFSSVISTLFVETLQLLAERGGGGRKEREGGRGKREKDREGRGGGRRERRVNVCTHAGEKKDREQDLEAERHQKPAP